MGSSWQDIVLAVGQLLLTASLYAMVRDRNKPPYGTSIPNVIILYIFALTFSTLSLWFATATSIAGGTVWLFLVYQRYRLQKKKPNA